LLQGRRRRDRLPKALAGDADVEDVRALLARPFQSPEQGMPSPDPSPIVRERKAIPHGV